MGKRRHKDPLKCMFATPADCKPPMVQGKKYQTSETPQLLEGQFRLVSAIALMTKKLEASFLDPHDLPLPENHPRRDAPHRNRKSVPLHLAPQIVRDIAIPQRAARLPTTRHQREMRLYSGRSNGSGRDQLPISNQQPQISSVCLPKSTLMV